MSQSLHKIYAHIVFSTKNRYPFLDENIRSEMFRYLSSISKSMGCAPVIVGGYQDHIHILCLLPKDETTIKVIQTIKAFSSKWIKSKGDKYRNFAWQNGYGAFSVHPGQVETVRNYIARQAEHHGKKDFQTEYLTFLKEYEMEYNEKYLWG